MVKLEYTTEEAALLYEFFEFVMEECMSLNTRQRLSKEPLFSEEDLAHLRRSMEFCAREMQNLRRKLRIEP